MVAQNQVTIKDCSFGTATISEHLEWPGQPESLDNQKFYCVTINNETRTVWSNGDSFEMCSKSGQIISSSWGTTTNNKFFNAIYVYIKARTCNWYWEATKTASNLGFTVTVADSFRKTLKVYSGFNVYLTMIQKTSEGWVTWNDKHGYRTRKIDNLETYLEECFQSKAKEAKQALFA